jgi:tRNA-specific 2-thiouridylase
MSDIVVALSGGVDSSVAAALLLGQGHAVRAVTLELWSEPGPSPGDCTDGPQKTVDRARAVADALDIPFEVVDVRELFYRTVVKNFIDEYAAARTPNPCVLCNRDVRFGFLLTWTRQQGAEYLATGHYARVRRAGGRYQLLRGLDSTKDQSYMLHALAQEQLRYALFPLGTLAKSEVRAKARELDLPAADVPESQDVCFVADGDYRRFLADCVPEVLNPGPIVDLSGNVLGKHAGLVNYTIGQRKGIGVPAPHPLYVLALDPERNALVVGTADEMGQWTCTVTPVHAISGEAPAGPFEAQAKIRYRHRATPVVATPLPEGRLHVRFYHQQRDITPGQYLVLYDGDVVIGGGPIDRTSIIGHEFT